MAGSLVPQSSFAQQGTFDWTALSRSSFTFSVEVMSRFSKAGVGMITCAMGQAMCSQFNVPPEGQKRVTDAISKLKAYSSYGQVLWFGFGVKHIVRSLCETKQGATCAALCACLRVSYSTEMSARVLSALCDQLLPSDGLSPALPQWAALIDVCSGALSPSKFPVMVDGFCRLAFRDRRPHSPYHKATTVDALAHALAELSKVSNGSVSSITFQGGYDCGWIAAVAEWLLCLKVKVLTEDGSCLYWQDSSHTNDSAQVTIIFATHPDNLDPAKTKELKVVNRTFRLPCNGRVVFILDSDDDGRELFGMGRSSWSTILEDTFGSALNRLLSPNIIGHFAKLLLSEVMACGFGDPLVMFCNRREVIHPGMGPFSSPAATREREFFLAIANRLPELSPLLEALEQLQKSTGAGPCLEGSQLWNFCDCYSCKHRFQEKRTMGGRVLAIGKICLHRLGLTLISLIRLLDRIDVDETIQPASTGLLMLYEHIQMYDDSFKNPEVYEDIVCYEDLSITCQKTLKLFTGLPNHISLKKLTDASVVCHGGICIWLVALEDPFYDPAKQMRMRVAPGKVSFRDRLYREIVDMAESDNSDEFASIISRIAVHGISRVCTLNVRETFDVSQLEAWIELRSRKTSSDFNAYLGHIVAQHPQRLRSELRLQIRKLYGTLHERIDHDSCEINVGRARSQDLPSPDLTTWERPCLSLSLEWESTSTLQRSWNYPEAGEWVVVQVDAENEALRVRLFRGDFSLLYSLMSDRYPMSETWLSCFDGCIRCLAYRFGAFAKDRRVKECLIEIHTITEKECTLWSAKMTRRLPEDVWEPHHGEDHSTQGPLDETGSSISSLDNDTRGR